MSQGSFLNYMPGTSRKYYFLILSALLLILCSSLYLACTRGLTETLEAESAQIAREFLQGGSLLINHLNGQEDLDKPPLFYWAIALFSQAAPAWELAARIPSILSVCLVLFLFHRMSLSMHSRMLFAISSLVFLTSPKVFWMSQIARIDMSFTAACFLAMWAFQRFLEKHEGETSAGTPWTFFISAAAAVMLKGPVGAILIFTPVMIFLVIEKRWALLRYVFAGRGMILFLLLSVPWFAAASIETNLRFFHRFILEENLSRFTSLIPGGTFKEFNHSPLYTYPVYLLSGFFPWSLLMPLWFFDIVRKWHSRDDSSRLFLVYIVFVLVFFSAAMSKRSDYILPLYPAAAFLTARYILETKNNWVLQFPALITMTIAVAVGCFLSLTGLFVEFGNGNVLMSVVRQVRKPEVLLFFLEKMPRLMPVFVGLFFIGLSGLYFSLKNRREQDRQRNLAFFALHLSILFLTAGLFIIPEIYKQKDARKFCKNIREIVADSPLFYFGFWDEECTFYLGRRINRIFPSDLKKASESGKRIFIIVREKDLKKLDKIHLHLPFAYKKDAPLLRPLILLSNKT